MDYVKFGNTGMDVSRLCLGAMSFGDATSGFNEWSLSKEDSFPIIKTALDNGINFFDTANIYSYGDSERILGSVLKQLAKRDEIVVATKVFNKMDKDRGRINNGGLSRKEIMYQIDESLQRLDMDYVDLYITHRWDYHTPIEETMEALHDVVKSGKARYIGASAMYAWQFSKANHIAEKYGWTKFVSMQNHMNLLYREEEREMLPYCEDQKIAVTPYSPLASGRLVRDWSAASKRFQTDKIGHQKYDSTKEQDQEIVKRVAKIAENHQVKRVEVALAWLLQKEPVAATIIGATKESHITDALPAVNLNLTAEEILYLEEPYLPHKVVGAI